MNAPDSSAAKKNALFGQARLDELTGPLYAAAPDAAVSYSCKIKRSTYLYLKQAAHHLAIVEQDFVDEAIREKLERTAGAEQLLPAAVLAKLRKNKKLGG